MKINVAVECTPAEARAILGYEQFTRDYWAHTSPALPLFERIELLSIAEGKVLLVLAARDETVERSSRNLREVRVILADSLNVIDLLEADTVVFTREALDRAQEVYA